MNLPHPDTYTGPSFRRTSVSFLDDSGGDWFRLKKYDEVSSTVIQDYVNNSINIKMDCSTKLEDELTNSEMSNREPSTSNINENKLISVLIMNSSNHANEPQCLNQSGSNLVGSEIKIINPTNCTFNLTIMK